MHLNITVVSSFRFFFSFFILRVRKDVASKYNLARRVHEKEFSRVFFFSFFFIIEIRGDHIVNECANRNGTRPREIKKIKLPSLTLSRIGKKKKKKINVIFSHRFFVRRSIMYTYVYVKC